MALAANTTVLCIADEEKRIAIEVLKMEGSVQVVHCSQNRSSTLMFDPGMNSHFCSLDSHAKIPLDFSSPSCYEFLAD